VAELHIELLGGLRVHTGAGRELRVVSRKAQALLGCLALQPGVPHSRDVLAGLLWEDSDPELARASLRQALASLRRSLPESCATALRCDAGTVMLDADLASSDVEQFRTLIRNGSPGALARAVERHAGVLLDGFEARSPAFDQWLMERRGELRRLLLAAAERMAAQCTAGGDDAGAIAALERLVGIEPSNERAQRDLMEALARQGRYTDALRQYRACRDALRRDLDVAPEAATEALHRELIRRRRAVPADDAGIDVEVERSATVVATPDRGVAAASAGPRSRRGGDTSRGGDTRRSHRPSRERRRRPGSGAQCPHGGAHACLVGRRAPRWPSRPADRGRDARSVRPRRRGG
jgi:DNA-binding SARP family transcriptional activator